MRRYLLESLNLSITDSHSSSCMSASVVQIPSSVSRIKLDKGQCSIVFMQSQITANANLEIVCFGALTNSSELLFLRNVIDNLVEEMTKAVGAAVIVIFRVRSKLFFPFLLISVQLYLCS